MFTQAQIDLRTRPAGRPVMRQRWRALLFLHFSCDPAEIQALLPPGLTVDTFPDADGNEQAWVGLVPFRMEGVRPVGMPAVPGLSSFPETNVRTYVHRGGADPGVWFFSLDADQAIACSLARRLFALPYHEARMAVHEVEDRCTYRSSRVTGDGGSEIAAEFGPSLGVAEPGTLEFFLVERYLLYAYRRNSLFTGRVHHAPYPLRTARVLSCRETLVSVNSIGERPFSHVIASDGVDVEVIPLRSTASL